jgi:hypothetical protein
MKTKEFFENHKYVLIKNFINRSLADYLYTYAKTTVMANEVMLKTNWPKYDADIFGGFGDVQVDGAFKRYADPAMDSLMLFSHKGMEDITGMELIPTYTYWRLYRNKDILKRHRDRPSCEISTTLCLGYDISNIKDKSYNWPMWIDETGSKTEPGKPIHMEPGDMIVYKGSEVDHWRLAFEGRNHAQVFMHYNNKNGPFAKYTKYDGRPFVALPSVFRNQQLVNKANDLIEMKNNNDTKDTSTENK